jgi:hypothetical protein
MTRHRHHRRLLLVAVEKFCSSFSLSQVGNRYRKKALKTPFILNSLGLRLDAGREREKGKTGDEEKVCCNPWNLSPKYYFIRQKRGEKVESWQVENFLLQKHMWKIFHNLCRGFDVQWLVKLLEIWNNTKNFTIIWFKYFRIFFGKEFQ